MTDDCVTVESVVEEEVKEVEEVKEEEEPKTDVTNIVEEDTDVTTGINCCGNFSNGTKNATSYIMETTAAAIDGYTCCGSNNTKSDTEKKENSKCCGLMS